MTKKTAPAVAPAPTFQAMYKENAVGYFRCCSDRFGELAALFDAIAQRTNEHDNLHKLATLGKDAAVDYENMADCWREDLDKGGFRQ